MSHNFGTHVLPNVFLVTSTGSESGFTPLLLWCIYLWKSMPQSVLLALLDERKEAVSKEKWNQVVSWGSPADTSDIFLINPPPNCASWAPQLYSYTAAYTDLVTSIAVYFCQANYSFQNTDAWSFGVFEIGSPCVVWAGLHLIM